MALRLKGTRMLQFLTVIAGLTELDRISDYKKKCLS